MQLTYLNDIFEDNYNIVHDRFKTNSVNVMKNRLLVAKKQRRFQSILAWLSLSDNHEIVTRNNNTETVRKPYWFVRNSCKTYNWKRIGLMLLVICNDVIKSS